MCPRVSGGWWWWCGSVGRREDLGKGEPPGRLRGSRGAQGASRRGVTSLGLPWELWGNAQSQTQGCPARKNNILVARQWGSWGGTIFSQKAARAGLVRPPVWKHNPPIVLSNLNPRLSGPFTLPPHPLGAPPEHLGLRERGGGRGLETAGSQLPPTELPHPGQPGLCLASLDGNEA